MPINVYTGLMGSGKSYEVVSMVILEAIAKGRRVITNVDGINEDRIHQHISESRQLAKSSLGSVIHVTNAQVFDVKFFPHYDDLHGEVLDTTVQPGDLVVIDEAWRFWPASGVKILKSHTSFFLEHRHFTHPQTNVCCDLVLMIQAMGTLHRSLRDVVAFSFRTHKKTLLGMPGTYSLTMYEGSKQVQSTVAGSWVRRYKSEIFPLYSSFGGGADGKIVNVDSRQNIFSNKKILVGALLIILVGVWGIRTIYRFFHPVPNTVAASVKDAGRTNVTSVSAPLGDTRSMSGMPQSDVWRIAGSFLARGKQWIVLTNASGAIRLESPVFFFGDGMYQTGQLDNSRLSAFSGSVPAGLLSPSGVKK